MKSLKCVVIIKRLNKSNDINDLDDYEFVSTQWRMNFYQNIILSALVMLCASCSSHKDIQRQTYSPHIGIQYGESPRAMNIASLEREIHRLTNEFRQKKGLQPFKRLGYLDNAARDHSSYMRNQSDKSTKKLVISHDNGQQRAAKTIADTGGVNLAENVGALHRVKEEFVAEKIVEGWITSKGHYKNLVGDFNNLGVGISLGKDYTVFATQVFVKIDP